MTASLKKIKPTLLLVVLLGLAVLLRLPHFNGSFWLDEAAQALESARPFSHQLDIVDDFQPPLLHLITFFAMRISASEWWLRLISALIPGLITIWATYQIGQQLSRADSLTKQVRNRLPQIGLLAALFLATSSFHIFYSQELRPYALPAMWALLSWLLILKPKFSTPNKKMACFCQDIPIFVGLSLLGLYSSYLYPLLLLTQFGYLWLGQKKSVKQIILIAIPIVLLYLPWLPMFWQQLQAGQLLRTRMPGWEEVVSIPQLKAMALVGGKFIFGLLDLELTWPYLFTTALLITLTLLLLFSQDLSWRPSKIGQSIKIWLGWLMIPLVTAWVVSFWIPVVRPKRLLFLQPALYLLLADLIVTAWQKKQLLLKLSARILLILLLAINTASTLTYYFYPKYQREDWRSLQFKIRQQFPADRTIVVFSYEEPFSPWRWYAQESLPTLSTGVYYLENLPNLKLVLKPIVDYDYVLVFDYLRDLTDPNDHLTQEIEAYGFKGIGVIDQINIGFVRVYAKKEVLLSTNQR